MEIVKQEIVNDKDGSALVDWSRYSCKFECLDLWETSLTFKTNMLRYFK